MKDIVIGPGKPKRVSKSPWECRIRKWAEDAQGKQMGQGCPRRRNGPLELISSVMGQESPK